MTETPEETAALSCLAALTQWFEPGGDEGALLHFAYERPEHVVEFLFGVLVATIVNCSEHMEIDPSEYVRIMALEINEDIAQSA